MMGAEGTTPRRPRVAIAGNPNTGKTTLFNRLTGSNAKVGNYPGVTVEREESTWKLRGGTIDVVDIPGTYSLASRSAEEQVAVRAIFGLDGGARPDLVIVVADSTQLLRNLYLAVQLAEANLPFVLALNLIDVARKQGAVPDPAKISAAFGVPVVAVSAQTGEGLERLAVVVREALDSPPRPEVDINYPAAVEADIAALLPYAAAATPGEARALALWSLLSVDDQDELVDVTPAVRKEVAAIRARAAAAKRDPDLEIVGARYRWLEGHDFGELGKGNAGGSERFDRVLLHPVWGGLVFMVVLGLLFQTLFTWSDPLVGLIESGFSWLAEALAATLPAGVLTDMVIDGGVQGVGSVVVFLPQIMLLFFLLGFLEDSGYMARVAFLVDRMMRSVGLHGRAFVPMLSGYACAVPAIMATRTLERRRDRLLTMMVVPLMSCSARLPVYTLVVATVLAPGSTVLGLPSRMVAMVGMYVFSTATALLAAGVLGKTLLKGPNVPLLLELPPYRMPRLATVLRQMWMRAKSFLTEAGTTILFATLVLWALLYFPRHTPPIAVAGASAELSVEDPAAAAQAQLAQSYGGRLGRAIEPVIRPLGFDWKIGVGLVGAFAAREVFVSTMGVMYGIGDDADETSLSLREHLQAERKADGTPVWTPLTGVSLMVFFALSAQCLSTLAVVRRESRSWRWPVVMFFYMTTLAWVASAAVQGVGQLIGLR
ncbi:ferrous iron transport protein B [Deltaproteobacteria bacterium]|nr:ferrous iron transport protein B [Deltaproteobacteria bacterium]